MPPDGRHLDGPRGWVVLAAAFGSGLVVLGTTYSSGVLAEAMATQFGVGHGAAAVVFSLTIFLHFLFGVVTGPLAERHGPRLLLVAGGAITAAGLLGASVASSFWIACLAYGLGVGIGAACVFQPMLVAIGGWFQRQRPAALGVTTAGSGLGTLLVALVAARLLQRYGLASSLRLLAAATAITLGLCALGAHKPPVAPATGAAPPSLRSARRLPGLWWLYASGVGLSAAAFVPFGQLIASAVEYNISAGGAASLVAVLGGANVVGRLGLGALASRWGVVGLYKAAVAGMVASLLLWFLAGGNLVALTAFGVLFGIGFGGWVALNPALVAHLYGPAGLGVSLGLLYTAAAVGGLFGPLAAGVVSDLSGTPAGAAATAIALALAGFSALLPALRPAGQTVRPLTTP